MHAANRFVFIDVETTGLNDHDDLLEVAVIVTDGEFIPIEYNSWVIHHEGPGDLYKVDPFVLKMHTDNGLWDACKASTLSQNDVIEALAAIVADYISEPGPICGSSPHFDRKFLENAFLETDLDFGTFFNHRVYDVSTLNQQIAQWGYRVKKGAAHRAIDDIRYSVAVARAFHLMEATFHESMSDLLEEQ